MPKAFAPLTPSAKHILRDLWHMFDCTAWLQINLMNQTIKNLQATTKMCSTRQTVLKSFPYVDHDGGHAETTIAYEWFTNFQTKRIGELELQDFVELLGHGMFREELREDILRMSQQQSEKIIMECETQEPGHFLIFPDCRNRLLDSVGMQPVTQQERCDPSRWTPRKAGESAAATLMNEAVVAFFAASRQNWMPIGKDLVWYWAADNKGEIRKHYLPYERAKRPLRMHDIQQRRSCKETILQLYSECTKKFCLVFQNIQSREAYSSLREGIIEFRDTFDKWKIGNSGRHESGGYFMTADFEDAAEMRRAHEAMTHTPKEGNQHPLGGINLSFMANGTPDEEAMYKYLECAQLIANVTQRFTPTEVDDYIIAKLESDEEELDSISSDEEHKTGSTVNRQSSSANQGSINEVPRSSTKGQDNTTAQPKKMPGRRTGVPHAPSSV